MGQIRYEKRGGNEKKGRRMTGRDVKGNLVTQSQVVRQIDITEPTQALTFTRLKPTQVAYGGYNTRMGGTSS